MTNILHEVEHGVAVAAKDTAHVAIEAVEFLPKAAAVIASAIKDEPAVKQAVLDLVKNAEQVFADGAVAVEGKGIDLVSDAKVLADAEAFFSYFKSEFIPAIEKLYGEIEQDIQ